MKDKVIIVSYCNDNYIPYILPEVKKAVIMDCDVINMHDIAELYDTSLDGYIVAASRLLARCVMANPAF